MSDSTKPRRKRGRPRSAPIPDLIPLVQLLRDRWEASGLTLDEVSARSGVPKTTVSAIFCGQRLDPTVQTLQDLLRVFGLRLDVIDET